MSFEEAPQARKCSSAPGWPNKSSKTAQSTLPAPVQNRAKCSVHPKQRKRQLQLLAQQSHGAREIGYFAGHHDSWEWHVIGTVNLSLRVGFSSTKLTFRSQCFLPMWVRHEVTREGSARPFAEACFHVLSAWTIAIVMVSQLGKAYAGKRATREISSRAPAIHPEMTDTLGNINYQPLIRTERPFQARPTNLSAPEVKCELHQTSQSEVNKQVAYFSYTTIMFSSFP